jgi:DNA-binding MarR family transcriptional regulator
MKTIRKHEERMPEAPSLKRELRKRGPFMSREEEAILNLWRTSDRVQIRFARLFRKYDLTPPQYNILRILRGEGRPLPILEVASRLVAVVPGVTGLIDRLEKRGLVARQRCLEDRRVIFAAITPSALKLLAQIDQPLAELHKQTMGHLSRTELAELIRLLQKTRRPFAEEP